MITMQKNTHKRGVGQVTRRSFVKTGALAGAGLLTGCQTVAKSPPSPSSERPNFLYIIVDQLSFDAISGHGCEDVSTPNIDRLITSGVSFVNSYSTDPLCSPARSSLFTGRMASETGVVYNGKPIHQSVPNMGQWLKQGGYETVYSGKWHLPNPKPARIPGFQILETPQPGTSGLFGDRVVSRVCEGYLHNRTGDDPFLLVASYIQPHDICAKTFLVFQQDSPYVGMEGKWPALPLNHKIYPKAPEEMDERYLGFSSDEQWKHFRYAYFRQIEMVDLEIGRVLDALDASPYRDNTVVIFTSDHGESAGCHGNAGKNTPYQEAVKVPLVLSCPSRMDSGRFDRSHLVSGLDIMKTVCDYSGLNAPKGTHGRSLRPLVEGLGTQVWREFIVSEFKRYGRMVCTQDFKYVKFGDEPTEQLFDMKNDPWETRNVYEDVRYSDILKEHRGLLEGWESQLAVVEPTGKRKSG